MLHKLIFLCTLAMILQSCSKTNYLASAANKQLGVNQETLINLQYSEKLHNLGHNFEPWKTSDYIGKGQLWINNTNFLRKDSLNNGRGRTYTSSTDYNGDILLYLDYGDETILPLTEDMFFEKVINTARYTPTIVLQHFIKNNIQFTTKSIDNNVVYSTLIGKYKVDLSINTTSNQIDEISYLSYDELYGDVLTSYLYTSYKNLGNISYPSSITIEKINGKIVDSVKILAAESTTNNINLLDKPDNYKLQVDEEEEEPILKVSKYNDYIHFIDLQHTDDKIMVVEFDDYMFVAEAPLNAKNGELIIEEVNKIAPQKPIKYFAFGHHHPHYLGGLRAFVHKEATVLCTDVSKDYVNYIANAPHTIQPDNLQLEPKKLKTQIIQDSLVLGGHQELKIYSIGDKSAHTKDYLLYYFPYEKLLFEDDLCWIPKAGPITKAGSRQVGLYKSIVALQLDVDTIIQSWPVNSHKVKTIIPFADLEKSVGME